MRTSWVLLGGTVLGLALLSAEAIAQQTFATQGTAAFSAERLFGFYGWSRSTEYNPPIGVPYKYKHTESGSDWSLLIGDSHIGTYSERGEPRVNAFAIPRLAFDFFVIDGLSVGGAVGYASGSAEHKRAAPPDPTVTYDDGTSSLFLLAPRVGYGIMFGQVFGIWPRAGFTYVRMGREDKEQENVAVTVDLSTNYINLDFEFMLVLSPLNHFAFVAGPVLDLGLSGGHEFVWDWGPPLVRVDADSKFTSYGMAIGLMGYL